MSTSKGIRTIHLSIGMLHRFFASVIKVYRADEGEIIKHTKATPHHHAEITIERIDLITPIIRSAPQLQLHLIP